MFGLTEKQNHRAGDDCYLTAAALEQFCHLITQTDTTAESAITPHELVILSCSAPVPNLEERYARELLNTIDEVRRVNSYNVKRVNDLRREYIQKITELYPHLIPRYIELIPQYVRQFD